MSKAEILAELPKSLFENYEGSCGKGFWPQPRRRGARIPAAGIERRANDGCGQKHCRPKGFRAKGRLASLRLGHSPCSGMFPRCASPYGLLRENRTPRSFQTGSKLPPDERAEIQSRLEELATSITEGWLDSEDPLTDEQKALLAARLNDLETHPEKSISWAEAQAQLKARFGG